MKKTISVLIALVMVLSMTGAMAADLSALSAMGTTSEIVNEEAGLTLVVPEGMMATDMSAEGITMAAIVDMANPNVSYMYILGYEEAFAGMTIADLTEEELAAMASAMVTEDFGAAEYTVEEIEGVPFMFIATETGMAIYVTALVEGWSITFVAITMDGTALTEDALDTIGTIMDGLQIPEA